MRTLIQAPSDGNVAHLLVVEEHLVDTRAVSIRQDMKKFLN